MRQLVVGVGAGEVSRDPEIVLVTYALGSCVAVMLHDPVAKVAGMVHFLLPESSSSNVDARLRPWVFADTGIPHLLCAVVAQGADKRRLVISAAGGAQVTDDKRLFNVGKRNCLALRKALWESGLIAQCEETGGTAIRTVRFEVGTGRVWLQTPDGQRREMNPRVRCSI